MSIGCWNVQGMNPKKKEIFEELKNIKMDLVVLSETKKKGKGNEIIDDFLLFYSGVDKSIRAKAGVAMAIHKRWKYKIKTWAAINERIMTLEINISGHTIVIIAVYAPNDDAAVQAKEDFYEALTGVLEDIGSKKEICIMGDFNGRVGKKQNNRIIGPYGENTVNENGTRLIELCEQHSLRVLNGHFQHKDNHKFTWCQPTRKLKSIIDYVVIKQNSQIRPMDVRVMRGVTCGSDHFLLRARVLLNYTHFKMTPGCRDRTINATSFNYRKYNLESFQNESTIFLYKLRLAKKISELKMETPEIMYNNWKSKLHETAMEAIGEKEKTTQLRNNWWSEDLNEIIEEKKRLYHRWLATGDPVDRKMYSRYSYMVKKEIRKRKNKFWEKKCEEVDMQMGSSKSRAAWNVIKNIRTNKVEKMTIDPIDETQWKKYYETLLTENRPQFNNTDYRTGRNTEIQPITVEEIRTAMKKMKNNKSPGPGGIPIELVRHSPQVALEYLAEIFNRCLEGEELPREWKVAHITSIFKKGDKRLCENYRGLSVTSSVGRLYGRILKDRIECEMTDLEEQSGFRAGRSCMDNLFCLKQLMEKKQEYGQELHLVFIDLKKAYDSVPIILLWKAMESNNISQVYIDAVKSLYRNNVSCVKTRTGLSEEFEVNKGLRQGCCLSPTLFKLYLNSALKQWIRKCSKMGVLIGDRYIYTLLFADDQVVLAEDEEDVNYTMRKLIEEYEKWGLEINTEKTQYMAVGNDKVQDIITAIGLIRKTTDYNYLGVYLNETGRDNEDILKKIGKGRAITRTLHSLLWGRQISKRTKTRMFKSLVESCVAYGSEVWTLNEDLKRRINAVETGYWRRCCAVTIMDGISNEEIRHRMNIEKTLTDNIEGKQLAWYGHLMRMSEERLPKRIFEWTPERNRRRGRPRKRWKEQIYRSMDKRNLRETDWENKEEWRKGCDRRPDRL